MTTGSWVQIRRTHPHEVSPPQPWAMNPLILENTKAECLWRGLSLSAPFGPWGEFPDAEQVRWFWLILCGDGATSNMRLYTKCIAESRRKRSRVLLHFLPLPAAHPPPVLHSAHEAVQHGKRLFPLRKRHVSGQLLGGTAVPSAPRAQ